jgi:hypothetical protein
MWQLFKRASDGSVFDPNSGAHGLAMFWIHTDPWLLVGGVATIGPVVVATLACWVRRFRNTQAAVLMRRLRPVAAALLVQVVMMLRDGYLPYPYVTAMLPFAALLIAGTADTLWQLKFGSEMPAPATLVQRIARLVIRRAAAVVSVAAVIALGAGASPAWAASLRDQVSTDRTLPWKQASAWISHNVPKDATIVVDNIVWPDLARMGYRNQVWNYKVDLDPAVKAKKFPHGWSDADYVVLGPTTERAKADMPTVIEAIKHSQTVTMFGDNTIVVYKVKK